MIIPKVAPSVQVQSNKPVAPANKCVLNPTAVKALMVTGAVLTVAGAAYAYQMNQAPLETSGLYDSANKCSILSGLNETTAKFLSDIARPLNVT